MPYNQSGLLYKGDVVCRLKDMGYNVKSVHALNLILEEMGILEHSGNRWLTTEKGVVYTVYNCRVFDADAWRSSIVDAVVEYLNER